MLGVMLLAGGVFYFVFLFLSFFDLDELFWRGLFVNSGDISKVSSFLHAWGLGHLCLCNQVQIALFNSPVIKFLYH